MTQNYTIETDDGIIIVRFSEPPGLVDLIHTIDDIAGNYLSRLRLWDISHGVNLTDSQISALAEYSKSKFTIPSKVAYIAQTDLSFGLARVLEVYREDSMVEQMVFRSERKAQNWLK